MRWLDPAATMITEKFMVAYRMIVKTSVIMLMDEPR
jgi:hypothetical protein